MSKYRFEDGGNTGSSDFFSSLVDTYNQRVTQFQQNQQEAEQSTEDDTEPAISEDYADLLEKYQQLEDRLNSFTGSVQAQDADVHDYGDSFLNFLFSDNQSNDPIDWAGSAGRSGAAIGSGLGSGVTQSFPQKSPAGKPTGNFRNFGSYEEGRAALEHQLDLYQTGKTKTGVKPTHSLLQAMSTYAPAADNNNPKQYAQFIAKKLGVTIDTPINQIDKRKWADAIEQMEGNKKGNNPGNLRFQTGGLAAANAEAKRFALSRGLIIGEDARVDRIPQYTDSSTGRPYIPLPTRALPINVPDYVQASDIQTDSGKYWYTDPKSGDVVDVDPQVVNLPRFRKPKLQIGGGVRDAFMPRQELRPPFSKNQFRQGTDIQTQKRNAIPREIEEPFQYSSSTGFKNNALENFYRLGQENPMGPSNADSVGFLTAKKMLRDYGSPKVTLNDDSLLTKERPFGQKSNYLSKGKYWDASMNLEGSSFGTNFIEEIPHAQQDAEGWFTGDWKKRDQQLLEQRKAQFIKENGPQWKSQLRTPSDYDAFAYDIPGHTEYDAHTVKEPKLIDRYNSILDSIEARKAAKKLWYQKGGKTGKYKFAGTIEEQRKGLNDPNYSQMYFPTQGANEFRGLDSHRPVHLQDSLGNQAVLRGPAQRATMQGSVIEKRL